MKTSQKGIDLIKSFEGYASKPYWDFKGYSGGYGHLGIDKNEVITKEKAEAWLKSDLQKFEANVNKFDAIYHFNQNQFDALVSFAYNIGSINKLCDGGKRSLSEISAHIPDYCHAGGAVNNGLVKRRTAEKALFDTPMDNSSPKSETALNEQNITLCGHGSDTPSLKNMSEYLSMRYSQKAKNGANKGLVAVVRLKSLTDSKRAEIKAKYATILGRNVYSQTLREYCYKPKNGTYYSDCSSSIIKTFVECGYTFPWTLNTEAIYKSDLFEKVPVEIKNGHVMNPQILKVGDCLLFAGNDPSRTLQIGHVEMVYSIGTTSSNYPKWISAGNDYYLRIADGKNAHGWQDVAETTDSTKKHRYYFDEKGKMLTGAQYIDNKLYYFKESGGLKGALCHTTADYALEPIYL